MLNDGVLEKILDGFEKSTLHTRSVKSSELLKSYLKELGSELGGGVSFEFKRGTKSSRELEKNTCAFGAQLSSFDIDTFYLNALFQSVSDHADEFFPSLKNKNETIRWLERLALHSYFESKAVDHNASMQKLLEDSTPLFKLSGDTPCLLLIGNPSQEVLSALLEQLIFFHRRLGTKDVIVSLEFCDDAVLQKNVAWNRFGDQLKALSARVCWVGKRERLPDITLPQSCEDRFDSVGSAHTALQKKNGNML